MTSKNLRVSAELRALYAEWCLPRRGNANPEIMTNDVWVWMIRDGGWPGRSHAHFGSGERKSPGWCFSRYGQSETTLPDGSIVYIGGEHEDWYDPDFYIYNDVVVKAPDGSITIFGYPPDVFPPTDSHTATLVGDQIFIVGRLGYAEQRERDTTPVYILDTKNFSIEALETSGTAPGWLFKHSAILSSDGNTIDCKNGEARHEPSGMLIENLAIWRLHLKTGRWDRLLEVLWTRWILRREDNRKNELWPLSVMESAARTGLESRSALEYEESFAEKGLSPDYELYRNRYVLPIAHEALPKQKSHYRTRRILVDGIVVRYEENQRDIRVTVEGTLPDSTISALKSHGLETFSRLDGVPYKIIEV